MQAAEQRTGSRTRARGSDAPGLPAAVAAGDDLALLSALPIAAAVVGKDDDGKPKVLAHNKRFVEAVVRSTCTATDWNDAECLKTGPIAELFESYFGDPCSAGELDLKVRSA